MNDIISKLEQIIADCNNELSEYSAETGVDISEVTFYDLGLDSDGCPSSFGNADDVYQDRFSAGCSDGRHEIATLILDMIKQKGE